MRQHSAASDEPLDEFPARANGPRRRDAAPRRGERAGFHAHAPRSRCAQRRADVDQLGGNIALARPTASGGVWRPRSSPRRTAPSPPIAGLVPLGIVLERAVGRAPASIYLAAGVVAGVVCGRRRPRVSASARPGRSLESMACCSRADMGRRQPPAGPVPWILVKRIAAAAVPFVLYNLVTDHLGTTSELAGLGAGLPPDHGGSGRDRREAADAARGDGDGSHGTSRPAPASRLVGLSTSGLTSQRSSRSKSGRRARTTPRSPSSDSAAFPRKGSLS